MCWSNSFIFSLDGTNYTSHSLDGIFGKGHAEMGLSSLFKFFIFSNFK